MITPEQFRFFAELVKTASGIALAPGKEYLLESRLNELARILGLKDLNELYSKAKTGMTNSLKERIIDAMTTNETYFFRDQHPFDTLKKEILPEAIKRNGNSVRIWSAACSTGQEPYSMAMLLCEHFPALSRGAADILATDISRDAVEKGKTGRFTQVEVNRGLPITLLIKYFKQNGAFWHANDNLRRMINFQTFNLLSPFNFGTFDVIFCRYVLIYFEQQTKQQILEKLAKSLNSGGCLILGATETPIGLPAYMERVVSGKTTYWKKNA